MHACLGSAQLWECTVTAGMPMCGWQQGLTQAMHEVHAGDGARRQSRKAHTWMRSLPTEPSAMATGSLRYSNASPRIRTFSSTPWPARCLHDMYCASVQTNGHERGQCGEGPHRCVMQPRRPLPSRRGVHDCKVDVHAERTNAGPIIRIAMLLNAIPP